MRICMAHNKGLLQNIIYFVKAPFLCLFEIFLITLIRLQKKYPTDDLLHKITMSIKLKHCLNIY